jgi:membrane-bound ClpP family serine protease
MSWTVIVALIVVGLLFLVLEILVIPGTAIIGLGGFVMIVFGIVETYHIYGTTAGHYTLAATIVLTILLLYFSLKSRTWKRMMLSKNVDGRVNQVDVETIHIGDTGRSSSRLAPIGKAFIGDKLVEVQSMSGFVDQDTEIVVVKINANKIWVKPKV